MKLRPMELSVETGDATQDALDRLTHAMDSTPGSEDWEQGGRVSTGCKVCADPRGVRVPPNPGFSGQWEMCRSSELLSFSAEGMLDRQAENQSPRLLPQIWALSLWICSSLCQPTLLAKTQGTTQGQPWHPPLILRASVTLTAYF